MPIAIEMPKLSDTMTEGTLVRWIKKVGDNVAVGDVLAEVETDKATMEMEAFDEGVLTEIYVQDGTKVEVGQKLAILLGKGEKIDPGDSKPTQENKVSPEKKRINPQPRRPKNRPGPRLLPRHREIKIRNRRLQRRWPRAESRPLR